MRYSRIILSPHIYATAFQAVQFDGDLNTYNEFEIGVIKYKTIIGWRNNTYEMLYSGTYKPSLMN